MGIVSGRLVNTRISTEFIGVKDPPELLPGDLTSREIGTEGCPYNAVFGALLRRLRGERGRVGLFGVNNSCLVLMEDVRVLGVAEVLVALEVGVVDSVMPEVVG